MTRTALGAVVLIVATACADRFVAKEPATDDARYVSLRGRLGGEGGPLVLIQQVPADERAIHLDLETDDVAAEVARLESLGARVKTRIRDWVVMIAPTGHAFCVVPASRPDFPAKTAVWHD